MHFGDSKVLASMAQHLPYPSLQKHVDFDAYKETFEPVTDDKIVLGYADPEFSTELISIPFNGQQFNAMLSGKKGSGKTNVLALIKEQFYWRYGYPCLWVDPKREAWAHFAAENDPLFVDRLKGAGLQPRGLPLFISTPAPLARKGASQRNGFIYNLELKDFKRIEEISERMETMQSFFGNALSEAAQRQLYSLINNLPDTFAEFVDQLKHAPKEIAGTDIKKRNMSYGLLEHVLSYMNSGTIGGGRQLYLPRLMMGGRKTHGPLAVLQLSLEATNDTLANAYLMQALLDIVRDRDSAFNGAQAFLNLPPVISIDEVDVFAPRETNPPSKKVIEHLLTKYRMFSISTVFATQKPAMVSEILFEQSDYWITSKLQSSTEKRLLKARGVSDSDIKFICQSLKYDKLDPVKEFAIIDSSGDIETFYPLKCGSAMLGESN